MRNLLAFLVGLLIAMTATVASAAVDSTEWYISSTDWNNDNGQGGTLGGDIIADISYYEGTGGLVRGSTGSCVTATSYRCEASQYAARCFTEDICGVGRGRWVNWDWADCPQSTTVCEMTAEHDPPAEPANCSDGAKTVDTDEEGIDCGGSCVAECVQECPPGFDYYAAVGSCVDLLDSVAYDDDWGCPGGYVQDTQYPSTCVKTAELVWTASSELVPEYEYDPAFDNQSKSTVEQKSVSTTDNGDGTSTITETITRDIRTSTGTVNRTTIVTNTTVDNSTGGVISEVTETFESNSDNEEGAVAGVPSDVEATRVPGSDDGSALDWTPLSNATSALMTKFPFSVVNQVDVILDTWIVTPQPPMFDVPVESIRPEPFVMDLTLLNPLAEFFRACLAFLAWCGGAYVIIRTWRG